MLAPDIILASRSKARIDMLKKAGLSFTSVPADLDEESIAQQYKNAADIARELAKQKALHVSKQYKDAYVIGSDQVLEFEGKIFSKAKTPDEAMQKLKSLRGKTHHLVSGVAVARNNEILWSEIDRAALNMKKFDNDFLNAYMKSAQDVITTCVGAYALEEHGAWLFEKVEGDFFTILGMPLLKLLDFLQGQGMHP